MTLSLTLRTTERPTFAQMLEQLYAEKHTGPVIVHFAQGHPRHVEIPAASTTFVLDTRKRSAKLDTVV
jgi:hypothetical protein